MYASIFVANVSAADCQFADVTAAKGLASGVGSRVSVADVNNDGYPDILSVSNSQKPFLYVYNPTTKQYVDVTVSSRVGADRRGGLDRFCTGALFADVDNDGDKDMVSLIFHNAHYLSIYGAANLPMKIDQNEILLNQLKETGTVSFKLASTSLFNAKTDSSLDVTSAIFCDYNYDGIADLFIGNSYGHSHLNREYLVYEGVVCFKEQIVNWEDYEWRDTIIELNDWNGFQSSRLLKGTGDTNCLFIDVTQSSGIGNVQVCTWGVSSIDFNSDGLIDLCAPTYANNSSWSTYIDTDLAQKHSLLWLNNGDGTFSQSQQNWNYDISRGWDCHKSSFGSIPRDYNNDGKDELLEIIMHGDAADNNNGYVFPSHTQILFNTGTSFDWVSGFNIFTNRYSEE